MRWTIDRSSFPGLAVAILTAAKVRTGTRLVAITCLATIFEAASVGAVIPVMSVPMSSEAATVRVWLPTWVMNGAPSSQAWLVAGILAGLLAVFFPQVARVVASQLATNRLRRGRLWLSVG
jgi:hypothetical protein